MPAGRALIVLGLLLVAAGVLVSVAGKLPLRLGHLPGDFRIQRGNSSFYFPLSTCILISVILSVAMRLFRK